MLQDHDEQNFLLLDIPYLLPHQWQIQLIETLLDPESKFLTIKIYHHLCKDSSMKTLLKLNFKFLLSLIQGVVGKAILEPVILLFINVGMGLGGKAPHKHTPNFNYQIITNQKG